MSDTSTITLRVNGSKRTVSVDPDTPLLWVLRDTLGLTGTKYGCGIGACGACTVLVGGRATRSCITAAGEIGTAALVTIEGLSEDGSHPLQRAWLEEEVAQCGFCQPGQIMTAAGLLRENRRPTDADIDRAMSDVICRCGTYLRIRRAIHRAAKEHTP
jgi:isoquinoline 1-oxidoreductase subunit alpha